MKTAELSPNTFHASFFECIVSYEQKGEDGMDKKVSETYTVDALTFTECEKTIIKEVSPFSLSELVIKVIKRVQYNEVFNWDGHEEHFYKTKVDFIRINENTGKKKRTSCYYLVRADSIETAHKYIDRVFGKTMSDYEIMSIDDTKIIDVFFHDFNANVTD